LIVILVNFVKILGVINQIPLDAPALSYGSEAWTRRRTGQRRLISAKMCFTKTAECRRNEMTVTNNRII
jgi:hypothetical protein